MNVLYVFPEVLPNVYARGVQVANTIASLLDLAANVRLAYVPSPGQEDPLAAYNLHPHNPLKIVKLSRKAPSFLAFFPVRSNRFFNRGLWRWLSAPGNIEIPDIIFTRNLKTAYFLLRRKVRIPVVYEAHEVFAISSRKKHRRSAEKMESFVLNHAACVITISYGLVNAFNDYYHIDRRYEILPSGMNSISKINALPQKNWDDIANRIVYVGSLFGWKGVSDLVEASKFLPECRITIIGGSNEEIEHLQRIGPTQGGAELVFIPRLRHAEVQAFLNESCIAILPNRNESISAWTSPIKLFEYMGAGCAVVASDLPPIREILNSQDAVFVKPGNAKSIADGILYLVSHPNIARLKGEGVYVKSFDFTWSNRSRKLLDIFTSITGC